MGPYILQFPQPEGADTAYYNDWGGNNLQAPPWPNSCRLNPCRPFPPTEICSWPNFGGSGHCQELHPLPQPWQGAAQPRPTAGIRGPPWTQVYTTRMMIMMTVK